MFNELLKNVMNLGIITEDDVKRLTAIELMLLITERINGLLLHVNNVDEKLATLLEEVNKITIEELNKWTQDGTFDSLINQSALKKVNERLDETNTQLSKKINRGEGGVITNNMLSQEVKESMTGGSVAVIGRNAVLNENIVDGQITHQKFVNSFLHSAIRVAPDTDNNTLNTLLPTGYMFVNAGSYGMPDDISNQTCLLENITCEDRFVYQKIHDYLNPIKSYVRCFDNSKGTYGEWSCFDINDVLLASEKIHAENLADNYLCANQYLSNSFDLNTLSVDGIFICVDVINKPQEITGTSLLINKGFKPESSEKARWVLQEIFDFTDISKHFYRKVDLQKIEDSTNWINANGTAHTSKFSGKKLVTFGDSITEGVGASNKSKNYPSLLSSKYELIVENKGIAGATWANYNDGYDNISVLTQISNTDFSDVDYVTIFAGTNDFGRGAKPIGEDDDMVDNTMKGAINLAIQRIIQAKPTIRIAIITPMWRQRFSSGDNKDADINTLDGKYLKEYVNAVKEMADYNHIPCLDFYHNCLINKHNYQTFLSDGLHPNDTGYELLADMIHAFLERTY